MKASPVTESRITGGLQGQGGFKYEHLFSLDNGVGEL